MWREEGVMVGVRQKEQHVPFNKEVEHAEGRLHGCCPRPLTLTGKAGCGERVTLKHRSSPGSHKIQKTAFRHERIEEN